MKKSLRLLHWFELRRGALPPQELAQCQAELEESAKLKREFEESQGLIDELEQLSARKSVVDVEFSQRVLVAIKESDSNIVRGSFMNKVVSIIFNSKVLFFTQLIFLLLIADLLSRLNLFNPTMIIHWLLTNLMGSFGALLMLTSGITAILMTASRRYKTSLGFTTVAICCFMLRSLTSTFFNDAGITNDGSLHSSGGRNINYNSVRIGQATNPWFSQPSAGSSVLLEKGQSYSDTSFKTAENHFANLDSDAPSFNPNRESYGQYEENPRFDPKTTPLSTFSIDVDTGSYTNMRRFIMAGKLPPADSVRLEEYVNYFEYDYESSPDRPFTVNMELAPSPLDSGYHLLRVGIKARTLPIDSERGWNLVFLVDVSGSMSSEDKLPLVKESLKLLTKQMRAVDRIALVTYAGNSSIVLDSTSGSEKTRILAAIDSLGAGGSTNGSGGIEHAYRVAEAHRIEGSVNRVVLATDGDFNVGVSSFDGLMKLIEEKRKSGITLTTLGFGQGNIQEQSMEQLANRGNGNYFYIDSFREARKVLESGLAANMEVVAKDVKLQMEFNPAAVKQYRLIGFDNRKLNKEDFANDSKDAGEIGSGHTVTALYEVVLTSSPLAQKLSSDLRYQKAEATPVAPQEAVLPTELGFLKVRYKQPEANASIPLEFPILTSMTKSEVNQASSDFKFAAAVAYFGEILRKSQFLGSYTLADVIELARASKGEDRAGLRAEFVKLAEDAQSLGQQ
jgi:Ca-activated chloride channel homolog